MLGGFDPDFHRRDLYDAIARQEFRRQRERRGDK